jgi:hypothetical protein
MGGRESRKPGKRGTKKRPSVLSKPKRRDIV